MCRPVDRPLDLLFILDGSGSTVGGGALFATQIETLNKIVDTMDIGEDKTRIGVMQYASYTYVEFPFKAYKVKCCYTHKCGWGRTDRSVPFILPVLLRESIRRWPGGGEPMFN